ncbi:MAG: hypothetical protein U0235_19965 [Polyangiaceae bacterium]
MRRAAILCFALSAAVAGCQKTASERLVGKWHGVKAEGVLPDLQQSANEAAQGMELEFKKDTVTLRAAKDKDPMASKYVVLREDKRSVVLVTEQDGAANEQTLTLDDDTTMRWQVLQGKTITFNRDKQP